MKRGRSISATGRPTQAAIAKALLAALDRLPVAFAPRKRSTLAFTLPLRP
jgi:hypothetical protein